MDSLATSLAASAGLPSTPAVPDVSPRALAARALLPRLWAGEDVTGEIDALEQAARARDDAQGECACLFLRTAKAMADQDLELNRAMAEALVARAQEAGLPVWESTGHHYLARIQLREGHEDLALNELVTAEVLTDGAEPTVVLVSALSGLAATYSTLGLFEDSERVYGQAATLDPPHIQQWAAHALIYNRLLNQVTWVLSLLRAGHEAEAVSRAGVAVEQARAREPDLRGSALWADIQSLCLFADLLTMTVDPAEGARYHTELMASGDVESAAYVHCALAHRFADVGDMDSARAEITAGLTAVHAIEGDPVTVALVWERARIASLAYPDHPGVADVWTYAQRAASQVWQLRLRRREAARDRLRITRLRREHHTTERQAHQDPLTGVANRRGLDTERTALATAATGEWVTVAYVDIDEFKPVNDTHGHAVGDKVLQHIATLLSAQTREADLVARYGGDEFVIIARNCGPHSAEQLAQRILDAVRGHDWTAIHPDLTIHVSVGIATSDHDHDTLFTTADTALYQAKNAGRNQASIVGQRITAADRTAPAPEG